ncbi:hypothetical protein [Ammoniphilus sp. YIM 78166]|uniref:hypothetical protein n=1 Tax=Ammoniphilus sp. YIM 78166 TaxID=1644106 RepID=UPI001431DC27|nr:hypothetical protein [Ammoniphilus sp. YIM 78166]
MSISEKLTGQQLQEILKNIYEKAQLSETLQAKDIIIEIKKDIISVIHSSK